MLAATKMMRSTFARKTAAAVVMSRPCLSEVLTKSLVIWRYDSCGAARPGSKHLNLLCPVTSGSAVSSTQCSIRSYRHQTAKRYFNHTKNNNNNTDLVAGGVTVGVGDENGIEDFHNKFYKGATGLQYQVPQRIRQKVISASDAASLVHDGDTVCVTGFVSQGKYRSVK
jgi:hypothetical protein